VLDGSKARRAKHAGQRGPAVVLHAVLPLLQVHHPAHVRAGQRVAIVPSPAAAAIFLPPLAR
jgi:hypothetical protein